MIIWLAELLQPYLSFFRLFEYLSFRAILSVLTALGLSLWMGPIMITAFANASNWSGRA